MTTLTPIKVAIVAVTVAASTANAQRGGGGGSAASCRPASAQTALQLSGYQTLVTSTDSMAVAFREAQKIPAVSASQVTYVTDNAICAKVEAPYTAALSGNGITPSLQVYVIKIGTVYVVWDPVQRGGEFQTFMTVSNKYKVLAKRSG